MGDGGTISVRTDTGGNITGGAITQSAATLLDAGPGGSVFLKTGGAGAIGAAGTSILTDADTITAQVGSGSAGVFITEANGAAIKAVGSGTGVVTLLSNTGNLTVTTGTLTGTSSQATGLSSFGDFAVGEAVGGGGPTPTGSTISSVSLAGDIVSLTITNGLPNGAFNLLESTNVLFDSFSTNQSGSFDGSGNASVTVTNLGGDNFLRVAEPTP